MNEKSKKKITCVNRHIRLDNQPQFGKISDDKSPDSGGDGNRAH